MNPLPQQFLIHHFMSPFNENEDGDGQKSPSQPQNFYSNDLRSTNFISIAGNSFFKHS